MLTLTQTHQSKLRKASLQRLAPRLALALCYRLAHNLSSHSAAAMPAICCAPTGLVGIVLCVQPSDWQLTLPLFKKMPSTPLTGHATDMFLQRTKTCSQAAVQMPSHHSCSRGGMCNPVFTSYIVHTVFRTRHFPCV